MKRHYRGSGSLIPSPRTIPILEFVPEFMGIVQGGGNGSSGYSVIYHRISTVTLPPLLNDPSRPAGNENSSRRKKTPGRGWLLRHCAFFIQKMYFFPYDETMLRCHPMWCCIPDEEKRRVASLRHIQRVLYEFQHRDLSSRLLRKKI